MSDLLVFFVILGGVLVAFYLGYRKGVSETALYTRRFTTITVSDKLDVVPGETIINVGGEFLRVLGVSDDGYTLTVESR